MITDELNEKINSLNAEIARVKADGIARVQELTRRKNTLVALLSTITPAIESALDNLGVEIKINS